MKQTLASTPNFPEIEHAWLKYWNTKDIYAKYLKKNATSKKRFSYIDGPITANNPMGVHHGWGRSYKDLWQKFHNLLGYKQRFQNGFDCQGLWVEVEVEKELGLKNKKQIEELVPGDKKASIERFVNLCKIRVKKFAAIQTEQSKRLGYFMDWEHSYFTMASENNYMIWHFLKQCHIHGWIYKGHESVPWCPRCETAISQHEMLTEDYKQVTHESVYLALPIAHTQNEYLLVWTTTPWTIPANIAVAVDIDLNYSLVEGMDGNHFWVAADTVARVFEKNYKKIIKTVKGSELVGLSYTSVFDHLPAVQEVALKNAKNFHTVIATDTQILPITTTEGTGLVHTAVSAGVEDFKLGKKYKLPMIPVIADNADYLPNLGFLSGKNAKKNPRIILDYLEEQDKKGNSCLFSIEKYSHRYPACWRCKTELVWKVADEWYIAMDKPAHTPNKEKQSTTDTLRNRMIAIAKKIKWIPSFGLDRELDWLKNMHDWLISKKNRYWGLSLPIYECTTCNSFEVIGSEDELKERAVEGWSEFEGHSPHKPWIDDVKISCKTCNNVLTRIPDVGNPWLDAGIVPYSTLIDPTTGKPSYITDKKYWKQWFPADSISESFPGQFKNWFYALIAMSAGLENTEPFRQVLGYATLLDEHGRPMHKSSGNMIEFSEGADKMGVDVMRWLYARQDPNKNLLFGYAKANEVKRLFHLPLWNIVKFYLTYAQLDSWNKKNDHTDTLLKNESLSILDQWIMSRLVQTVEKVYRSINSYRPAVATAAIEALVLDISQWYIRQSRQRVWVNSIDTTDKNALYSTLDKLLSTLCVVISPILPFFSEELYQTIDGNKESVHLENWPTISKQYRDTALEEDVQLLRSLAEVGHSQRKEKQLKVRQPLAGITFTLPKKSFVYEKNNTHYAQYLCSELNVKNVTFQYSSERHISALLDTTLTEELTLEGKVRDILRTVQQIRKDQGCSITEHVDITIPSIPEKYHAYISQRVLADSLHIGDSITVTRKK